MKTDLPLWLDAFVSLFYPVLCPACMERQPSRSSLTCLSCALKLPKTQYHLNTENNFTERFWGRIPINGAAASYHFISGGRTQRLIHHLKYRGRKDIGIELGRQYGMLLSSHAPFQNADLIIPVPLHRRKQRKRGYNQSECFAEGLAQSMKLPCETNLLLRKTNTGTQTRKSRIERYENVQNAFVVKNSTQLAGKHILLVDDVVTTGATLEACANKLMETKGVTISLAAIAIAKQ